MTYLIYRVEVTWVPTKKRTRRQINPIGLKYMHCNKLNHA